MDILRFINSKDIRKYLRDINYEFNSLEAAWLIYKCCDATINEKHEAWNELIKSMPDCKIEKRPNTVPQESLHTFLKQYMELEDKYVDEFLDEQHSDTFDGDKPYVYRLQYIYDDGSEYDQDEVFSCLDTLHETIMEEDVICLKCKKMQIDRVDKPPQVAYLTPSFEILKLDPVYIDDDAEEDLYLGVFDGLWFEFPTPFKRGDIAWVPYHNPTGDTCWSPFVITEVGLDYIENDKIKEDLRKHGDYSSMDARGYFMREDGSIFYESMWNYMSLEFYNEELTGSQRTLIALSNFIKGEIDTALFARAYHQILTNGYAEDSIPQDYLKSGLVLAGLCQADPGSY